MFGRPRNYQEARRGVAAGPPRGPRSSAAVDVWSSSELPGSAARRVSEGTARASWIIRGTGRGAAAAAARIVRGRVAAPPRLPRGHSTEASRRDAYAGSRQRKCRYRSSRCSCHCSASTRDESTKVTCADVDPRGADVRATVRPSDVDGRAAAVTFFSLCSRNACAKADDALAFFRKSTVPPTDHLRGVAAAASPLMDPRRGRGVAATRMYASLHFPTTGPVDNSSPAGASARARRIREALPPRARAYSLPRRARTRARAPRRLCLAPGNACLGDSRRRRRARRRTRPEKRGARCARALATLRFCAAAGAADFFGGQWRSRRVRRGTIRARSLHASLRSSRDL